MDEVMASEGEEGLEASYESAIAAPGAEAIVTADLTRGNWVIVCPLPTPDGEIHAELGMVQEFTVTG